MLLDSVCSSREADLLSRGTRSSSWGEGELRLLLPLPLLPLSTQICFFSLNLDPLSSLSLPRDPGFLSVLLKPKTTEAVRPSLNASLFLYFHHFDLNLYDFQADLFTTSQKAMAGSRTTCGFDARELRRRTVRRFRIAWLWIRPSTSSFSSACKGHRDE